MTEFFQWLQSMAFATYLRESGLPYPIIMSTHLAGMGLFGGLIGRGQFELGFSERGGVALAVGPGFHVVGVIEEGHHLVELLLREGVEFVVVALRAADGGAEESGADGGGRESEARAVEGQDEGVQVPAGGDEAAEEEGGAQ